MKKILLSFALLALNNQSFAKIDCLVADVQNQAVYKGYVVPLTSRHQVTLTNTFPYPVTYKYAFVICTENESSCERVDRIKTLYPTQNFTEVKTLTLNEKYHVPGTRIFKAHTQVEGAESGYIEHSAILTVY